MIHQGMLLKSVIEKSGLSVEKVAIECGYSSKQSLYGLFKKSTIKKEILQKIDEIVTINFKEFGFVEPKKNDSDKFVAIDMYEDFKTSITKSLEEKDKIIQEKERLIQRLEKELDRRDRLEDGFFSDFKNFLRQYSSLGSEKKHNEIGRSQTENNTLEFFPERKQKVG